MIEQRAIFENYQPVINDFARAIGLFPYLDPEQLNLADKIAYEFMSLLNISLLNEIIIEKNITRPDLILNQVRDGIIHALNPDGNETEEKDGMDCILCSWQMENSKWQIEYAASNNAPLLLRQGQLIELYCDNMPVGMYTGEKKNFTLQKMELQKGDVLYTFSDGYSDQFGGEKEKKFMRKNFKKLLMSVSGKSLEEQRTLLAQTFNDWKGAYEQTDDVLVIGVQI